MNFLKKYKIVFIFAFVGIAFFIPNSNFVKAKTYSCTRAANTCAMIAADPYEQARGAECSTRQTAACTEIEEMYDYNARVECNFFCGKPKPICNNESPNSSNCPTGPVPAFCQLRKDVGCPKPFGCIRNGVCNDIQSTDFEDAKRDCQSGEALPTTCPSIKSFSCYQGEECTQVKAVNFSAAKFLCTKDCPNCQTDTIACMPKGESIDALQTTASEILNPGGLGAPTQFFQRAINILMAFTGSITLVLYVIAGLLWMTASGNGEQADRAKRIMVWTTLGVFVMLFSYVLVNFLFNSIPK